MMTLTSECISLKLVGVCLIIIMLSSALLNTFLFLNLIRHKILNKPINTFVAALTGLNLIGTFLEMPIAIASLLKCRWVFDFLGYDCGPFGFIMYSVGTISIGFMIWISVTRFIIIYRPHSVPKMTYTKMVIGIHLSVFYGLFWSTMPLFGWSHYSLEANNLFCSVEWHERTLNVQSYNVCMFIFVFFIPLVIIVATSVKSLLIVRNSRANLASSLIQTENRINRNLFLFNLIYIVSWTPYAVQSFCYAFNLVDQIPTVIEAISAVFAKSSMLSSAIFFIFSYRDIRFQLTQAADLEPELINDASNKQKVFVP